MEPRNNEHLPPERKLWPGNSDVGLKKTSYRGLSTSAFHLSDFINSLGYPVISRASGYLNGTLQRWAMLREEKKRNNNEKKMCDDFEEHL